MDLLTHATIGAASAMLAARPTEIRAAALAGAVAGMLPDADALIRSSKDALLYLEYHRHFSHALLFIPFGALLASALLWPLLRKSLPFPRLFLFCLLGTALAGFLDACTSYGTHLFWPFAETRIAWNIISIFDPLFTLLLAIPVVWALRRVRPMLAGLSLLACAAYLGLGWVQHQRAAGLMEQYVAINSLHAERVLVKPTFGNLILWRGIAATPTHLYVAAVRPGLFDVDRSYPGENAYRVKVEELSSLQLNTRLRSDLERFSFFTDNLLSHDAADPQRIGDARYAMMPDSLRPMWSVSFDRTRPDRPVELITDRQMSTAERSRFIKMLTGSL